MRGTRTRPSPGERRGQPTAAEGPWRRSRLLGSASHPDPAGRGAIGMAALAGLTRGRRCPCDTSGRSSRRRSRPSRCRVRTRIPSKIISSTVSTLPIAERPVARASCFGVDARGSALPMDMSQPITDPTVGVPRRSIRCGLNCSCHPPTAHTSSDVRCAARRRQPKMRGRTSGSPSASHFSMVASHAGRQLCHLGPGWGTLPVSNTSTVLV